MSLWHGPAAIALTALVVAPILWLSSALDPETPTPAPSPSVSLGPAPSTSATPSPSVEVGEAVQARRRVTRSCERVTVRYQESTDGGPWVTTRVVRRPTGRTCPPVPTVIGGGR